MVAAQYAGRCRHRPLQIVYRFAVDGFTATPHNSRLAAQAPLRRLRHGICVAKMLDNVGLRYPHRASGAKAPRTLRPLPLLRFAVSATGGAHLCSIQYYLRFWLGICRTSLAVSALRIMRYCLTFLRGAMRASRPTNLYNKSGALPISSAPLHFVLCSFIAPGAPAPEAPGRGAGPSTNRQGPAIGRTCTRCGVLRRFF